MHFVRDGVGFAWIKADVHGTVHMLMMKLLFLM